MGPTLLCELGLFLLCTLLCTGHAQDAVLTIEPNCCSFFIGEFVTFMCDMNEGADTDWYYKLNKDGREFVLYNTHKYYRLQITSTGYSGEYQCFGHWKNSFHTKRSNTVSVTVSDKPRATLTAGTTIIPVGGSVTLTCSVGRSAEWKYEWFRRTQRTTEVQIRRDDQPNRVIRVSQGGIYRCRGGRGNPVFYTEYSESVRIDTIVSNKAVVTLHPNWTEIYRGETITVRCEIHGGDTEWDYEWETNRYTKPENQNEYRIRSASSSNSGNYRCKGRMKSSQHKTTEWSDSVTLTVSDKPRPVLTVSPSWLSPGASVTLNCEVEHPSAGWSFYW
ncbi:Fc receptor-like protein 4, partial [Archocentrus centrarchus]|uniref:Fc receptor-like protein 4 n=1 Tax=Archocentrus centrarchus TaxID=63155 RepID=UPI0011E9E432